MTEFALPLGGYLVGSVPFGYLFGRRFLRRDIRTVGSGNVGATNVLRSAGLGPALAVLALDIAKGALPVALAMRLGVGAFVAGLTALGAVLGHVFPIYIGFRGGKGVATALGALSVLAPVPTALGAVTLLGGALVTRYVSLGSMIGSAAIPVAMLAMGFGVWTLATGIAIACLIVFCHSSNVRRLLSGTERKLGDRALAPSGDRERTPSGDQTGTSS